MVSISHTYGESGKPESDASRNAVQTGMQESTSTESRIVDTSKDSHISARHKAPLSSESRLGNRHANSVIRAKTLADSRSNSAKRFKVEGQAATPYKRIWGTKAAGLRARLGDDYVSPNLISIATLKVSHYVGNLWKFIDDFPSTAPLRWMIRSREMLPSTTVQFWRQTRVGGCLSTNWLTADTNSATEPSSQLLIMNFCARTLQSPSRAAHVEEGMEEDSIVWKKRPTRLQCRAAWA